MSRQQKDGIDILISAIAEFWALMTEHFRKHPEENGETYLQHFLFAMTAGIAGLAGGVMLCIHAVFPFFLPNNAGDLTIDVASRVRGKRDNHSSEDEETP